MNAFKMIPFPPESLYLPPSGRSAVTFHLPALLLAIGLLALPVAHAQDSVAFNAKTHTRQRWGKALLAPSLFILTGLAVKSDHAAFNKYVREERNESMPRFRTHADDYLQYASVAAVYGLQVMGMKSRNNVLNQTVRLIESEVLMAAMVIPLKKLTAVPRPDSGAPNSFPSGHTAQAFVAATFFYKEYGKDHPGLSIVAYSTATGIGVLRVLNNRHWTSDVLVGAGIGILSTNLAYLLHKPIPSNKRKKLSGIAVVPSYSQRSAGLYLSLRVPYHR